MRLSELLDARVVDADGTELGSIEDVRLAQDGPLLMPFGAALRVEAVVAGRGALGTRLGFVRGDVRGPWLLRWIFGALERRARYVPWEVVESWADGVVRVTVRASDLGPPPPP